MNTLVQHTPINHLRNSKVREYFEATVPHCAELEMRLIDWTAQALTFVLPFRDELLSGDEQPRIHSAILGTLLDTACGGAVLSCIPEEDFIATLDMRVDHYNDLPAGYDLFAQGYCERLNDDVAHAVAIAWSAQAPDQILARATAAFMRTGTRANPILNAKGDR